MSVFILLNLPGRNDKTESLSQNIFIQNYFQHEGINMNIVAQHFFMNKNRIRKKRQKSQTLKNSSEMIKLTGGKNKHQQFNIFLFLPQILDRIKRFIITKSMSLVVNTTSPSKIELLKTSISRAHSNSSTEGSEESPVNLNIVYPYEMRMELFQSTQSCCEITQKVSQKAVSWLITLCWSKNLSQECLWSAVLLFYALKAQKKIKKESLELTLLACLHLSAKMASAKAIALKELTASTGKAIPIETVVQMQALILENFNYNIMIPHYISQLFYANFSEDQIEMALFLFELLMLKDCEIFFNKEKIKEVIKLIDQIQNKRATDGEPLRTQIKESFSLKEAKIILKKYEPKFRMEYFMVYFAQ